jgi:hypothetical protein
MAINAAELAKFAASLVSWSHAFTAAAGAFLHKAYLWVKAKLAAAEADAKAEVKKL